MLLICPKCGIELTNPYKTWSTIGNPIKTGKQCGNPTIGFFSCPECEKRVMKILDNEKNRGNLKGVIEEIKGIETGLIHMLGDLKEKIEKLKKEKAELLEEIEELKRTGETKASTLEEEIASLREEIESLKEMLDENE